MRCQAHDCGREAAAFLDLFTSEPKRNESGSFAAAVQNAARKPLGNHREKKDVNFDDRSGEVGEKKGLKTSEVDRSEELSENKGVSCFHDNLFKMNAISTEKKIGECNQAAGKRRLGWWES